MPHDLAHFAIHADDVPRAKAFYEAVFGWTFTAWGPPNFWLIETSPGAPRGALQERRGPLTGEGMRGFECTIAVEDLDGIAAAIREHGGQVTFGPMDLETVGTLIMAQDTEGNVFGCMRYLPEVKNPGA